MYPMRTGGGFLRKLVVVLVIGAALMLVVKSPADAASWVRGIGHLAANAIDGLTLFLRHVLA
jgi:hypothetical protein